MATKQGANSFLGVGRQSAYASLATRTHFTDFNSEGLKYTPTYYNSPRLGSPSRRVHELVSRRATGPVTFEGNYEGGCFLALLKDTFGSVLTSSLNGTARSHAFSLAATLPEPGLSVEIDKDGDSFLYTDCKVGRMRLTQDPSQLAMFEFTVSARGETTGTPTTVTAGHFPWRQPMLPHHIAATVDGSPLNMFRFEVTVDNTLADDRRGLGSLDVRNIVRGGQRMVSGSFELEFEDLSVYNNVFKDEVEKAWIITWTGGAISGSSDVYKFTLTMPRVRLIGDTPPFSQHGPINFSINFEAFESERRAQDEISITVQNTVASVI